MTFLTGSQLVPFDPESAEKRFGYGLSPKIPPIASADALLRSVSGPDTAQDQFPIENFAVFRKRLIEQQGIRKDIKAANGEAETLKERSRLKALQSNSREARAVWFHQTLLRRIHGNQNFRERLAYFWGDHFTAIGKSSVIRDATSPYVEDAVRPHLDGRFGDLLVSCVTHPLMVDYLDQTRSVGPGSLASSKSKKNKRNVNENLAREVLELHTLGVGGPYSQTDVRELAELFTGLSYNNDTGRILRKDFVEPGTERVLGNTYGPDVGFGPIEEVLQDLAVHPATAAHIARKLAVHFVSDRPDPKLVAHIETAYRTTDGDLMAVYAALLEHPAAWATPATNVKPPVEFISSALRALAIPAPVLARFGAKDTQRQFLGPMQKMGQQWQRPDGPDGWSEDDSDWITPQGLAARLEWAVSAPGRLLGELPDPREFAITALGRNLPERVAFVAGAAESRREAIGLILASPAFQRR
jgi:uncharacterized protein (DUF1800 family)